MKLARKLALALIVGVTLVLVANAYLRVQREIGLFESDMRRDDRMMARALRAAVSEVWRSEGEAAALRVVEVANAHESSVTIRWVLAGSPPDHPLRAKADGAATSAAAQDETVEERLATEDGREELVTYVGVPVPDVRELDNCMERAAALCRGTQVSADDLPEKVRLMRELETVGSHGKDDLLTLDEVERRHVLRVLDAVGGNKTVAAEVLGLDRATLYRKLARIGR